MTDGTDPSSGTTPAPPALGPGAAGIVRRAREAASDHGDATLGVNHWLLAVVTRYGPMAAGMAEGLDVGTLGPWLHARLRDEDVGRPLDEQTVVESAAAIAARHGRTTPVESDVVEAVLTAAGYRIRGGAPTATGGATPTLSRGPIAGTPVTEEVAAQVRASGDAGAVAGAGTAGTGTAGGSTSVSGADGAGSAPATTWTPRATRPTPTLDTYGRDLTAEARAGRLPALIGRETELSVVLETLCRSTKRNPALVGPAGTGKTAIVEGLAARIVSGDVPALLRGFRIVQLSPASLVAGAGVYGVLDERMKAILAEASQDGIALFIDELHSIVGAGGARGSSDIASLLKPALARGEIACIAATTDEEYRRYIEEDPALERRFAPILVREPTVAETIEIVRSHRDALARLRGVAIDDDLLGRIVRFAGSAMPDRRYPDKAVELLEQVVAHAVAAGATAVTADDVDAVGRRLTGLPTEVDERLDALVDRLTEASLLTPADADAVVERIGVGMRGADVRRERPNAVVLLAGEQARIAPSLAGLVAEGLFGSPDRVVTVEAGRMTDDHDISMLIGAPPGYIGYSDDLPVHAIDRMRACVVLIRDVDQAHPAILDVLGRAIASGVLSDGAGRPIHLAETVVLLSTAAAGTGRRPIGFGGPPGSEGTEAPPPPAGDARAILGALLGDEVDVVVSEPPEAGSRDAWIARTLLPEVAARFAERGITLTWDASVPDHLAAHGPAGTRGRAWERYLDGELGPLVADRMDAAADSGRSVAALRLTVAGASLAADEPAAAGTTPGTTAGAGAAAADGTMAKAPDAGAERRT